MLVCWSAAATATAVVVEPPGTQTLIALLSIRQLRRLLQEMVEDARFFSCSHYYRGPQRQDFTARCAVVLLNEIEVC